MMTEEWKDVEGYEGCYQVSNLGNIKSLSKTVNGRHRPEIYLKQMETEDGYLKVFLCKSGIQTKHLVHRIVAKAFVNNPNPGAFNQINHKDENPKNNVAENLEWCDCTYNVNYGTRTERARRSNSGENSLKHKLKNNDVLLIRAVYHPHDKEFGAVPLAKKFGVSRSTIERAAKHKSWKYTEEDE